MTLSLVTKYQLNMFLILSCWPQKKNQFITKLKIILKEVILLKQWRYFWTLAYQKPGGSQTVIESLITDLKQRNVNFRFNDFNQNYLYSTVFVFSDLECLRWAIEQKKKGLVKKLIAGPFISTLPFDNHYILDSEFIDELLFASSWLPNIFYKTYKHKNRPYKIWSAGIDHLFWVPDQKIIKDQYLIYIKSDHFNISTEIANQMKNKNIKFNILRYGSYNKEQYKVELQKSMGVIFISPSETQGLASFEAWSCDIPTLHWNPEIMIYLGETYEPASSCPYLDDTLGSSFKTTQEFSQKFDDFQRRLDYFSPRNTVLKKYKITDSTDLFLNQLGLF